MRVPSLQEAQTTSHEHFIPNKQPQTKQCREERICDCREEGMSSHTVEKNTEELHTLMNSSQMILESRLLFRRKVVADLALVGLFSSMRTLVVDQRGLVAAAVQAITVRALVRFLVGVADHVETQLGVVWGCKAAVGVRTAVGSLACVVRVVVVHVLQDGGSEGTTRMQTAIGVLARVRFEVFSHRVRTVAFKRTTGMVAGKIVGWLLFRRRLGWKWNIWG